MTNECEHGFAMCSICDDQQGVAASDVDGVVMLLDPKAVQSPHAIASAILLAMRDMDKCPSTDTIWLTETETVFERFAELFKIAGGSEEILKEIWPEYFGTEA